MKSNYESIRKFCNRHRIQYLLAKVVNIWLLLAGSALCIGAVFSIFFYFYPWTALPVIFDIVVVITVLACISVLIERTLIHPPSLHDIASMLEKRIDKKHQYLSIALELGGKESEGSSQLIGKVCSEAEGSFNIYPKRLKNIVGRKRIYAFFLFTTAFVCSVFLCKPLMLAWWDIPFVMFSSVRADISPGTIAVPASAKITLKCTPKESLYPSAILTLKSISQSALSAPLRLLLRPDSSGCFTYTTDSLYSSLEYVFTLGNRAFSPETVVVVQPPVLYSLKVTLQPPAYTHKNKVQLPEGQGAINAYEGTKAAFSIKSLFPLKNAFYIHENHDTLKLDIIDGNAQAEIRLWNSGRYTFLLEDTLSQMSDSLPEFYITILPDYKPNVRIVKPGINKILTVTQQETLWVEAVDDFGIKNLTLEWKKSGDNIDTIYKRNILSSSKYKKLVRRQVAWDLTKLSLYPGDSLFYWAYSRDNKPYGKPQICYSDTFFFRLPTFEEIHRRIAGESENADNALSSVQKLQKDMKDRLESLIKSAKGKESLSWEEKKIVEDIGESIHEQADSLNKAVEALQDAVEKMKESVSNKEILDKMDKVQESLEELIKEYGDSLFFKTPSPDEKVSWDDMKEAMEKMAKMLPDFQDRLDNVLKYLEMLKKEIERAMLAKQARELAEQQMQIAQLEDSNDKKMCAQDDLSKRTDNFLKEAQDNINSDTTSNVGMEDVPSMEHVKSLQEMIKSDLLRKRMPCTNTMNQMSTALQSLSVELESTLSSSMAAKAMKDREILLNIAQDVMNISQWQDGLAESIDSKTEKKMSVTEQQTLKEAFYKSIAKLDSLEFVPPPMIRGIISDANKAISEIKNVLESISSFRAGSVMKNSVHRLNTLAGTLLSTAEKIKPGTCISGGSGSGMMYGLQKLSAKQAAINSATTQMLRQMFSNYGKDGGMSEGEGDAQSMQDVESARKAAQKAQNQLANQLDELAKKYEKTSESSLKKRVEEMEEEARRIAKMFDKPSPQISERQDRFLMRMLQSTLSLHKQDKGKEQRKSKSASILFSEEVSHLPEGLFKKTDTFYNLRIKAMDGNIPDSYRMQVQAYFDSLGVLFLKEN